MPILSIIIPTHNRAKYAVPTIRSALSISPDVEVVVSDTSQEDHISGQFVNDPDWSRVRLVRPGQVLSVVDNFNQGLQHASGDYLLFLGDDDLVTPKIADLLTWAKRNRVDAIQLTFPAIYYWPDFMHKRLGDHYAGTLHLGTFSGAVRRHDAKRTLREAAEKLGGGVFDMPRAYAGIVSKDLVQAIVAKQGSLFGGVSPDIYSAALIADAATHCVSIDYPVIVPGSSGASTAGQSANGKHIGALRDNAHIGAFRNLIWDDLVPEFYSVPTVWSYSLLRALKTLDSSIQPNYGRLYVRCLFYHRYFLKLSLSSLRAAAKRLGWAKLSWQLARGAAAELQWIAGKLLAMARSKYQLGTNRVFTGITDTQDANLKISEFLQKSGPPLDLPHELAAK